MLGIELHTFRALSFHHFNNPERTTCQALFYSCGGSGSGNSGIDRRHGYFRLDIFDLGKADLSLPEKKETAWVSWHWGNDIPECRVETLPV